MKELSTITEQTMTSREVAELTGKRHSDVLRDLDSLIKSLNAELRLGYVSTTYKDSTGKSNRMFQMDRDSSICLVSGYDANARMKIIKRWQELEASQQAALPQTYIAALEALVKSEKEKEVKAAEIAKLNTILDRELGYCSILRAAAYAEIEETNFKWRVLKSVTLGLGMEVKRVPSPRYKYMNLYPIKAFEIAYPDIDFDDLKPEKVDDLDKLAIK